MDAIVVSVSCDVNAEDLLTISSCGYPVRIPAAGVEVIVWEAVLDSSPPESDGSAASASLAIDEVFECDEDS